MSVAFFCLHCDKKFERWANLQRHNKNVHCRSPDYVELSDRQSVQAKKLGRCFIYQETPATALSNHIVTKVRPASSEELHAFDRSQSSRETLGQAPAAKKQKQQQAFAAAIPSFEAQYLATAFVQYILPEGAYSNPRQAAVDLLHELAALPEPEADVEAKAISELDKDAPYVKQSSGGIKAVALEELLPHVIGQMLQEVERGSSEWSRAGIEANADTIAASVAQAVNKGHYLHFNLKFDKVAQLPPAMQALQCIRQAHAKREWGWCYATGINLQDPWRGTLVLLGIEGTGTDLRVDWSEAENLALAFEKVKPGTILAVWTFFHPAILHHVNAFVQGLQKATGKKRLAGDPTASATGKDGLGYSGKGHIRLCQRRVQDLRADLAHHGLLYDDMGIDMVPIIEQRHGDIVHVPAGHMHQVENMAGCVKMAWDKYVVAHLDRYALSWRYITNQIRGRPDYMGASVVVKNAILELATSRKCII
ncbi:hypothetical protein WJX77_011364 [Trebouxia sp. C0004]